MTLRIEKDSDGQTTTIRLIGRMRREHIEELKAQIKAGGTSVALDLNEVSLVDLDVIRFLATCQTEGFSLRPLFSLYKQLDRQRAVQRSIKLAENSTRNQAN